MAKEKYIVKGNIMGMPLGSVIAVDPKAVEAQGLGTILELAPEGAKLTVFNEDGSVEAPESAPDNAISETVNDDAGKGAKAPDKPVTAPKPDAPAKAVEKPAATPAPAAPVAPVGGPPMGGPPMPGKAVVTPVPGK